MAKGNSGNGGSEITTKKPKKWKNEKDWKKMDKYIKKHKLNPADFED